MPIEVLDAGQQVSYIIQLNLGTAVLRPRKLGKDQVFGRHDEERVALHRHRLPSGKLLAPIITLFSDDQVHLDHIGDMDQVKHGPLSYGPLNHLSINIKLVLKSLDYPVSILLTQFHDEINVPCHAWHGIEIGGHGSCDHVWNSDAGQPLRHEFEDFQFFAHPRVLMRVIGLSVYLDGES